MWIQRLMRFNLNLTFSVCYCKCAEWPGFVLDDIGLLSKWRTIAMRRSWAERNAIAKTYRERKSSQRECLPFLISIRNAVRSFEPEGKGGRRRGRGGLLGWLLGWLVGWLASWEVTTSSETIFFCFHPSLCHVLPALCHYFFNIGWQAFFLFRLHQRPQDATFPFLEAIQFFLFSFFSLFLFLFFFFLSFYRVVS